MMFAPIVCCCAVLALVAPAQEAPTKTIAEHRVIRVPNTTVSFTMVRCPSGDVLSDAGERTAIPSLWVLETEVVWELYDIFVYSLDKPDAEGADAVARPSKPYVPPDRGFGHDGYPAMGMTRKAAERFCAWLSLAIGAEVRLPSEHEWTFLARGGEELPAALEAINTIAWTDANADYTTHPVGTKPRSAFGLADMLGNVAEWVTPARTNEDTTPFAMGGGYRDPPGQCLPTSKQAQTSSWNASDPQIPKSEWWLADCSWVGFRFVAESLPNDLGEKSVREVPESKKVDPR